MLGVPASRIGADVNDPTFAQMCVHHATAAAVMAAGAGDDMFAHPRGGTRRFVDRGYPEVRDRIWHLFLRITCSKHFRSDCLESRHHALGEPLELFQAKR